ncbi:hypothetical protein QUF90_10925 [Desulfococcaceae bacterium HSG9]|nr:hypothetical protein [Desulfococcaceae bacterium HSG9]
MVISKLFTKPSSFDFKIKWTTVLILFLALAPITGEWIYKVFIYPRPFWAFYYDPETIYFYSGLELLNGQTPNNVDNPGTPVQLISAALLTFIGRNPLNLDCFRVSAYIFSQVLMILMCWMLLKTLLLRLSPMLQISALQTFFLCSQSLEYNNVWSPEILYFPIGSLVIISAWSQFNKGLSYHGSALIGFTLGLACAVKFTFLAWIPAMFLAVLIVRPAPDICKKYLPFALIVAAVLGFLAATFVVASKYPYMFQWLWRLASHSGEYGTKQAEIPSMYELITNVFIAVRSSKAWHFWLFMNISLAGFALWRQRQNGDVLSNPMASLLIFAVVAIIMSYILAARHMALRYLLPTGVCGMLIFAICSHLFLKHRSFKFQCIVCIVVALLLAKHITLDISTHQKRIHIAKKNQIKINASLSQCCNSTQKPIIIYGFRAPQPSFALRISTADNLNYLNIISKRYPYEGHINWHQQIVLPVGADHWDCAVISKQNLNVFPQNIAVLCDKIGLFYIMSARKKALNVE